MAHTSDGNASSSNIALQDLIDDRQVALFDAFDKLSRLEKIHDIKAPHLVVIGSESSGKSSVLEAIARFHFPMNESRCTRFPIKLMLRRSEHEHTHVSIIPSPLRSPEDKTRLEKFHIRETKPFADYIREAADSLGVVHRDDQWDAHSSGRDGLTQIPNDVLVVAKSGPGLPLADLVDLPGLYLAANEGAESESREMVEKYIKSKNNLILFVISARRRANQDVGLATILGMLEQDPDLMDRVVGVITNPDGAESFTNVESLVRRTAYPNLKCTWHILRNQNATERVRDSLELRDQMEEREFLLPPWTTRFKKEHLGIKSLRATLKKKLWYHTHAQLGALLSTVQKEIMTLREKPRDSRSDHDGRRRLLHGVARKFETISLAACQGTYQGDVCTEPHRLGVACPCCISGFGRFGDQRPETQDKNLRANIRALSKQFAMAMREYGKSKEIVTSKEDRDSFRVTSGANTEDWHVDEDMLSLSEHGSDRTGRTQATDLSRLKRTPMKEFLSNNNGQSPPPLSQTRSMPPERATPWERFSSNRNGSTSPPLSETGPTPVGAKDMETDSFPEVDIVKNYYVHEKPKQVDRAEFVKWVADNMSRWRGREPQGEPSEALYARVFRHQSEKWPTIACKHLDAVWAIVHRFLDIAFSMACPYEDIRDALRAHMVRPKLDELEISSRRTLQSLLNCHRSSNTGFYDGFIDIRQGSNDLEERLALLKPRVGNSSRLKVSREMVNPVRDVINGVVREAVSRTASDIMGEGLVAELVGSKVESILTEFFHLPEGQQQRNTSYRETDHLGFAPVSAEAGNNAAARVIAHVETRYEMSMVAFVGYVNALVVENGILQAIPKSLLTTTQILDLDAQIVEELAGEKEAGKEKRERDEHDLSTLDGVEKTLKQYI